MTPGQHHEPSADAGGSSGFRTVPVIGLAHGSRLPSAAADIERLMVAVGRDADVEAYAAYLDLAEPDLAAVARRLAETGHRRAVVVPLLFTVAFHATVDVPEAVVEAADAAGIELSVADIIGTGDDVTRLLADQLTEAGVPDEHAVLLYAVGSSRPAANEAVVDLAARLAMTRHGHVRAAFGTTDPRPEAVLPDLSGPVALLPLFLADGLLLNRLRTLAAERGWTLLTPLADRAAALVVDRYRIALGS